MYRWAPLAPGLSIGLCLIVGCLVGQTAEPSMDPIHRWIEDGRWQAAAEAITRQLARSDLDPLAREQLEFEQERMRRIRLDFNRTREQVLAGARAILPGLTELEFDRWDEEGAVEAWEIDGTRWYFERAAANLFRIHPEARRRKETFSPSPDPVSALRRANLREILREVEATGSPLAAPRTFRVRYTLTVKPGVVPVGERIRAWLPFPHREGRQQAVRLLASRPASHQLTPAHRALSAIYLEQPSAGTEPTPFEVQFEYSTTGYSARMDPRTVTASAERAWCDERPPHLVFDDRLRAISREIVGTENRPYQVAQRLFQWVTENIPWAGAREYSTIESLPAYALRRRHGDCGIQAMLFIALCRLNGIPARWESGWTTEPEPNLHDWCTIHLPPYGWIPVDVSYGLISGEDDRERGFYFGGLDSYRLVVNTDYGQPLHPPKQFVRSEPVDFQRGEVEWRGGNLYFDQWDTTLEVETLGADSTPAPVP